MRRRENRARLSRVKRHGASSCSRGEAGGANGRRGHRHRSHWQRRRRERLRKLLLRKLLLRKLLLLLRWRRKRVMVVLVVEELLVLLLLLELMVLVLVGMVVVALVMLLLVLHRARSIGGKLAREMVVGVVVGLMLKRDRDRRGRYRGRHTRVGRVLARGLRSSGGGRGGPAKRRGGHRLRQGRTTWAGLAAGGNKACATGR
jgi:hypothetical protein